MLSIRTVKSRCDRAGQGQSEYTLMLGLIAIVLVGVLYFFGTSSSSSLQRSADAVGSSGGSQKTTGAGGM